MIMEQGCLKAFDARQPFELTSLKCGGTHALISQRKAPKTAAGLRDVDLNSDALEALKAQRPYSQAKGLRIWLNPRTSEPWETDAQLRKTFWLPLTKRAGVDYRNPYQVRHTFASTLLTDGHNPWAVAAQLGHENVELVFSTYGKFIREDYQKPKPELRMVGNS